MIGVLFAGAAAVATVHLPEAYMRLVPRVDSPFTVVCEGALYEGNNLDMRGAVAKDQVYARTGDEAFAQWRAVTAQMGGIFVLRDSLISQQDHPYRQETPRSLLVPPNWVTAAATAKEPLKGPVAFAPEDDAAWMAVPSAAALVGGFPPSDALYQFATKNLKAARIDEKRRIRLARTTLGAMARLVAPLIAAQAKGQDAAIDAGAKLIVDGDAAYFGKELREKKIIPIFVENPRAVELAEGKGFETAPDATIPGALRKELVTRVYGARLAAGGLALERYDLSDAAQRQRAIDTARWALEGAGATKNVLWLWVTGKLVGTGELRGEDATAYVAAFRKEMAAAGLDPKRVRLLSKPVRTVPKGTPPGPWLKGELERFAALDLPLSTTWSCAQIKALAP